jgi:hypothetical protein
MSTQAQLEANRANAQLSTGPKTTEGKAKVSHNAVKNGLTGATVLLPSDDAALYELHVSNTIAIWAPATHREQLLVQSIADTEWRLQRIPALESGMLALGRLQHADLFQDHPEPLRATLLDAYIHETKARDLRNLQLQERRLRTHREKDLAELQQIQKERLKRREEQLNAAAHMCERYGENGHDFDPAAFGFEFSIEEIEERIGLWEGQRIGCDYPEQFGKYIHAKLLKDERLGLLGKNAA